MIVVDTNILFSHFKIGSTNRKLLSNLPYQLVAPIKAHEELRKYSADIRKKSNLKKEIFEEMLVELEIDVTFIERKHFEDMLVQEINDANYIEFVALSKKLNAPLWTHDAKLNSPGLTKITTKDLIDFLL